MIYTYIHNTIGMNGKHELQTWSSWDGYSEGSSQMKEPHKNLITWFISWQVLKMTTSLWHFFVLIKALYLWGFKHGNGNSFTYRCFWHLNIPEAMSFQRPPTGPPLSLVLREWQVFEEELHIGAIPQPRIDCPCRFSKTPAIGWLFTRNMKHTPNKSNNCNLSGKYDD